MRKSFFLAILLLLLSSYAHAGSVELSTYYPAPFGVYDRLRLVPRASLSGPPCDPGTIYVDNGTDTLQFCDATGNWGSLAGGFWSKTGNSLYPTNTTDTVGIGTTSPVPTMKLHVAGGDILIDNSAFLRGRDTISQGWGLIGLTALDVIQVGSPGGPPVTFQAGAGPERMRITNTGNVGIGTTTPGAPLEIFTNINGGDWDQPGIKITNQTGEAELVFAPLATGRTWTISANDGNINSHQLRFYDNSLERLVIDQNGNVGIGTTTPLTKLHLYGTNAGLEIRGTDSGDNEVVYQISQVDGSGAYVSLRNEAQTESVRLSTFGNSHFTGGNVGIGTTTPTGKLMVLNTANTADLVISNEDFARSRIDFLNGDTTAEARIQSESGGNEADLVFSTVSNSIFGERMRIDFNGNVGIGTMSPASSLQVNGYIQLKLTAGVPPAADCDAAAEEGRMIFDPTADRLYICSGVSGWVFK